ncbi:hypothetical protein [Acinetobacter baumannii]|uniref:hypothetical protein n=1 Tax=Acinetobacter baumannii TaxID=470 RepID=UPI001C0B89C5|nr:hypothetical protein [Acinetobacter baumannii]MBU3167805.1 hypothetical protein [Acinetobacter baumannii]MDC4275236.1 hypothetical protein [Acinetobacter baumannii]MDC4399520.1 hypothetical protein [Acinetobacter baumannii]MDC4867894.1 hypothetical protein [Acinetobacter baumannii]MDC5439014.1 hypothetical protein [Acinetobacter baumannii]
MKSFFINLQPLNKEDLIQKLSAEKNDKKFLYFKHWVLKNEIKPVDLYCYLYAKYGSPKGLLTLLRNKELGSANLIQWDWMLKGDLGTVHIQGHNFRTEVFIAHNLDSDCFEVEDFLEQIKADFKNYGKEISNIKKSLEKWTEFVNPFFIIRASVSQNFSKLKELQLDLEQDKVSNIFELDDDQKWTEIMNKYYFAVGLIHGLRSMLPVLAESFINCIIFILCKPEIKSSSRLYDSIIRQQIDIRIQSLHLNCNYFTSPIDYNSEECKNFHTLMNERNDILHGNINIKKQSFGEVYFDKNMAIYDTYQDHWEKSIGILINSVKLDTIFRDLKVVEDFIEYIYSKLEPQVSSDLKILLDKAYLGFNPKTGRIGILFQDHFADFKMKT